MFISTLSLALSSRLIARSRGESLEMQGDRDQGNGMRIVVQFDIPVADAIQDNPIGGAALAVTPRWLRQGRPSPIHHVLDESRLCHLLGEVQRSFSPHAQVGTPAATFIGGVAAHALCCANSAILHLQQQAPHAQCHSTRTHCAAHAHMAHLIHTLCAVGGLSSRPRVGGRVGGGWDALSAPAALRFERSCYGGRSLETKDCLSPRSGTRSNPSPAGNVSCAPQAPQGKGS